MEEEMEEVVEEVSSASSVSIEVFREINRGRKADLLSGIASSPLQSVGESLLTTPTSRTHSRDDKLPADSPTPASSAPKPAKMQNTLKHDLNSDMYRTRVIHNRGHDGAINGTSTPPSASAKSSGASISDISARIAALLVARKIEVPRLNTESVSSYVPSDQPGTLSSMSDVLLSPSSSLSG